MADAKHPEESAAYAHPAYVIGVVGHMNFDEKETERLEAQIKAFLLALIRGEKGDKNMALQLPADWEPLGDTPVILLSSLAPGADTLAAKAALALRETEGLNIEVAAPLPFPRDIYPTATSFMNKTLGRDGPDRGINADAETAFNDITGKISDDNIWHVELAQDEDRPALRGDLARQAASEDEADKEVRNKRYDASGEYVANFCNLLIVIVEQGVDSKSWKSAEGKLQGFVSGSLRNASGFTWASAGAVVHFPCQRISSRSSSGTTATAASDSAPQVQDEFQARPLLWYFPEEPKKGVAFLAAPLSSRASLVASKKLVGGAKCLVEFNQRANPAHEDWGLDEEQQKAEFRKEDQEARNELGDTLNHFGPKARAALEKLGRVRRRAANGTGRLTGRTDRITRHLFWMAIASALCLHMWVHPFTQVYHFPTVMLVLSAVAAFWAYRHHAHYEHGGHEARDHDWRVLAEGGRVQLFWAAAGIDHSVAASYMQRHRIELHWMRMALSSLAAPYQRWKSWFPTSRQQQFEIFGKIHGSWLNKQRKYFINSSTRCDHKQHSWAELAFTLALSALMLAGLAEASRLRLWTLPGNAAPFWGAAVVILIVLTFGAASKGRKAEALLKNEGLEGPLVKEKGKKMLPIWRGLQFLLHELFPTKVAAEKDATGKAEWLRTTWVRVVIRTALALIIAVGCLLACEWVHEGMHHAAPTGTHPQASSDHALPTAAADTPRTAAPAPAPAPAPVESVTAPATAQPAPAPAPAAVSPPVGDAPAAGAAPAAPPTAPPVPDHAAAAGHSATDHHPAPAALNHFSAIWVGTLLLFGALAVAWRENRLFSEHSRQYHTMATLYSTAHDRMRRHLKVMDEALKAAVPNDQAFDAQVEELRKLLIAVGEEALDENAEWLILHRSRPLEPLIH